MAAEHTHRVVSAADILPPSLGFSWPIAVTFSADMSSHLVETSHPVHSAKTWGSSNFLCHMQNLGHPLRDHELSEEQYYRSSSEIAGVSEYWFHVDDTSPSICRWLDILAPAAAEATSSGIGRPLRTSMLAAEAHEDPFALVVACSLL